MTIYAIIPARGGSKGVPGKNIRVLGGHPLIAYSIAAAKPAETRTTATDEAKATVTNATKGMKVYFISRGCVGCQVCRTFCPAKAITALSTVNATASDKIIRLKIRKACSLICVFRARKIYINENGLHQVKIPSTTVPSFLS